MSDLALTAGANRSGREPERHRSPSSFIQQEPDLTGADSALASNYDQFYPSFS